ncbi:hypothetical protein, partial [Enterococcus faecium]
CKRTRITYEQCKDYKDAYFFHSIVLQALTKMIAIWQIMKAINCQSAKLFYHSPVNGFKIHIAKLN